jgi:hypothetical protein
VVPKTKTAPAETSHVAPAALAAPLRVPTAVVLTPADEVAAIDSPARQLQRQLEDAWGDPTPARWSARRSLTFIVGVNLLLWAGLIAAVRAVV